MNKLIGLLLSTSLFLGSCYGHYLLMPDGSIAVPSEIKGPALLHVKSELKRMGKGGKVMMPIFDDATIITREIVKELSREEKKSLHLYSHRGVSPFSGSEFGEVFEIERGTGEDAYTILALTAEEEKAVASGKMPLPPGKHFFCKSPGILSYSEALSIISHKIQVVMDKTPYFELQCGGDSSENKNLDAYWEKIAPKFIEKAKDIRKIACLGKGLRVPNDKILYLSFLLFAHADPSIEEARKLIVPLIKDCTELIASNSDSRKFFLKAPDSIENAQIAIFFRRSDGREQNAPVYVSSCGNKIYYSKRGLGEKIEDFYEETFTKAEQALATQNKTKTPISSKERMQCLEEELAKAEAEAMKILQS